MLRVTLSLARKAPIAQRLVLLLLLLTMPEVLGSEGVGGQAGDDREGAVPGINLDSQATLSGGLGSRFQGVGALDLCADAPGHADSFATQPAVRGGGTLWIFLAPPPS